MLALFADQPSCCIHISSIAEAIPSLPIVMLEKRVNRLFSAAFVNTSDAFIQGHLSSIVLPPVINSEYSQCPIFSKNGVLTRQWSKLNFKELVAVCDSCLVVSFSPCSVIKSMSSRYSTYPPLYALSVSTSE